MLLASCGKVIEKDLGTIAAAQENHFVGGAPLALRTLASEIRSDEHTNSVTIRWTNLNSDGSYWPHEVRYDKGSQTLVETWKNGTWTYSGVTPAVLDQIDEKSLLSAVDVSSLTELGCKSEMVGPHGERIPE